MRIRVAALAGALALISGACGSSGGDGAEGAVGTTSSSTGRTDSSSSGTAGTARPGGPNEVPDAALDDVATGDAVSLRSLIPAEKPVLFWFWAPH